MHVLGHIDFQIVCLDNNKISSVDSCVLLLPTLRRLDITRNSIRSIHNAFGKLENIAFNGWCLSISYLFAELTAEGNPLDRSFAGLQNSDDMLLFLEAALSSGTKKIASKIKLVFIGDGGVGKTSILKSFARDASFLSGKRAH